MSDEKQKATAVTVVLLDDDRVYAERLRLALEQTLRADGHAGSVRVSVVKLPK